MDSDQLDQSTDSNSPNQPESSSTFDAQANLDRLAAGSDAKGTTQPSESRFTPQSSRQNFSRSRLGGTMGRLMRKKRFWALGGLGIGFIGLFLLLFLFLNIFKLNHIKNLFIDYQFAGFHRSISRRIDHIVTSDAILSEKSASLPEGRGASLYEKLRGYRPNEALRELGKKGLQLEFDDGRLGRRHLSSISDTTTGEKHYRQGAKNIPDGATVLSDSDFLAKTRQMIEGKTIDHNHFFRRKAVNDVFDRSGIRLIKWKEWKQKFGDKEPTPEQAREETVREQIDDADRKKSAIDDVNKAAEAEKEAALKGESIKSDADLRKRFMTTENIGKFSTLSFVVTMYCIFRDIGDSIERALDTRVDNMMKVAADTFTKADMQKDGQDVPSAAAIGATVDQFEGFEESAAYQRAAGEPVTGPDLAVEDYPTTMMGFAPSQVKTLRAAYDTIKQAPIIAASGGLCLVPGINKACSKVDEYVTNKACSVILNPYVQGGVAAVEVVAFIASLGGEQAVAQTVLQVAKEVTKLAAGITIAEYVFGHVLPGVIHEASGVSSAGIKDGKDRANRVGTGTNLLKNEIAFSSGAHQISDEVAAQQTTIALAERRAAEQNNGSLLAMYNLKNPYSTGSRFLASIPSTPRGLAKGFGQMFAVLFNPTSLVSAFSSGASAAPAINFHGVPQMGWEDSEITCDANPKFCFEANTTYVEANFEALQSKYKKCFGGKLGQRLQREDADCNDSENLRRYGVYILDCYSVEQLNTVTNNKDTYHQSDCSILTGTPNRSTPSSGTVGGETPSGTAQQLAQRLLDNSNVIKSGRLVEADLQATAEGKAGSSGSPLNQKLLSDLVFLAENYSFYIVALESGGTGHTEGSNHYSGNAADIVPAGTSTFSDMFRTIYDNRLSMGIDELIFHPAPSGTATLDHGQPLTYDDKTLAGHTGHIHFSVQ